MVDIFDTGWFKEIDAATTPGNTLRIYRENAELTQEELAKKLSTIFQVPADRFL